MARYPDAIWRPTDKHGYAGNDTHFHQGVVIHSAEGSLGGLFGVLLGPREASWHFSVAQLGRVFQHVDTDNIAWTNGSQEANRRFWGIECEGGGPGNLGEPLTEPQYQSLLDVVRWLWQTYNLGAPTRQDNLWEHNEMTRYGAASTSCPSGRIPWQRLIADLQEEDMAKLDQEDREWLAGLAREVVGALCKGEEFSARMLTGAGDYRRGEHSLRQIVRALPAGSGGGLSEAKMRQIVREEIDKTKTKFSA